MFNLIRSHSRFFWMTALIGGLAYYQVNYNGLSRLLEKVKSIHISQPEGKHRQTLNEFESAYFGNK